ncbi:phage holin family protein [Mycobacterium talmoniae]|uniref:Phage holin family protein n=1 Tax=Mycobacterium talmoniae TaxID=1858794 RepID=A0A1S1N4W2_9MYCO|nr:MULTISPECIES: phage holin family protein [Mycobacterium]OHU93293.1 hypothetical protein BKN37_24330 [Mycobacterium talmoniae]PQM46696.1 hypothetical protein C1Y40_03133 [Mycobacterium talmoniae]TDH49772.1 hypothetical protein E2F47_19725 [Mycobacterium eburneum]
MGQILLRGVVHLVSWAIGMIVAAWAVPNVSVTPSAVIVAAVLFSIAQAGLAAFILKLPHGYASLLLGGTGLVLTLVAMGLTSVITQELSIRGFASWIAATVVVWLVTTIGAILLPEVYARNEVART